MTYTIGLGILVDSDTFNFCRAIELDIAAAIADTHSLIQPPHITVKRPFAVKDRSELDRVIETVRSVAGEQTPFTIEWDAYGGFGNTVRYLAVKPKDELKRFHLTLLSRLEAVHDVQPDRFESDNVVFHTSVVTDVTDESTMKRIDAVLAARAMPHLSQKAETLGVFLDVPGQGWIVVEHIPLA